MPTERSLTRSPHAPDEPSGPARPDLPPGFALVVRPGAGGAFAVACGLAAERGAGTLVWDPGPDHVDLAVVLEPDEALGTARRVLFAGMSALVQALASVAPADKPLTLDWPDTVRFDGARLGGGRLGWPEGGREEAVPAWMVFGATLIASKAGAGDPGLTPGSTSLEEEGFPPESPVAIVDAFSRYLLRALDLWREDGFGAVASEYLARLPGTDRTGRPAIDAAGNLVWGEGKGGQEDMRAALAAPAWLDPRTGTPRL